MKGGDGRMGSTLVIPAGSEILFGAPARPLPADVRGRIATGLGSISGILEAHLPMCHIPATMPEPAQVLIGACTRNRRQFCDARRQ